MIPPPPRPTLFPLHDALPIFLAIDADDDVAALQARLFGRPARRHPADEQAPMRLVGGRSEEHTSELQSRVDLVCRLLLEKKKKTQTLINSAATSRRRH